MSRARDLADSADKDIAGTLTLDDLSVSGTVTGNVTGDLTGDVTGNLTGDTIGTHTGAVNATNITVTGVVTGNVTGDILGDVKADNGTVILDSGTNGRNAEFTGDVDISAIAATISDTAVDIFVYDTRKDSDGGAWRKRTQHTSWYNETLNTATRGSRKEFPAVAVIVAEQEQITIYDGDDPDLPMWMVFNTNSGWSMLYYGTGVLDVSAVAMLNGKLCVTSNNNPSTYAAGVTDIDFVKDRGAIWYKTGSSGGYSYFDEPISGRNVAALGLISISSATVVHYNLNDVAMTVLPNAPIDAATGLPVPTIAVGCADRGSIIRDDGTVATIGLNTNEPITDIAFDSGNNVVCSTGWAHVKAVNLDGERIRFTTLYSGSTTVPKLTPTGTPTAVVATEDLQVVSANSNAFHRINYSQEEVGGANNGFDYGVLHNAVTSSYNTGWMNGDIKLATLSDTDATNVTGSELVTNGTFDTDTSGWTALNSATLSVVSGALRISQTTVDYARAEQAITVEVGKTYTVSVELKGGTGAARVILGTTSEGTQYYIGSVLTAAQTISTTFTATTTTAYLTLTNDTTTDNTYYDFDNISVRLAEEDRSVNGNGLQVFGTVTKSAVATGADLVGYSGFSTSNYLEQPYNADLQFGTGDFCIMGWFKTTGNGITLLEYGTSPRSGEGYTLYMDGSGQLTWYKVLNGAAQLVVAASSAQNNGVWTNYAVVRRNGIVSLYFNGAFNNSGSDATNITNSSAKFRIGLNHSTSFWSGSIALTRISATAPSPEQIARIYNDEKHLFTEGAQATLYGSSDSVTALAYDTDSELLHVGTSAGRSVFQGLRRVDNTTTAVTSAISASNGLVADE